MPNLPFFFLIKNPIFGLLLRHLLLIHKSFFLILNNNKQTRICPDKGKYLLFILFNQTNSKLSLSQAVLKTKNTSLDYSSFKL